MHWGYDIVSLDVDPVYFSKIFETCATLDFFDRIRRNPKVLILRRF